MRFTLALPLAAIATLCATAMADAATTTCQTVASCVLGINQGSGYAVQGYSRYGTALVGTTVANTTQASGARAGVAGYDRSTGKNAFNASVAGKSAYGTGVVGTASNGIGVAGFTAKTGTTYSNGGVGVLGRDTTNDPTQTANYGVRGLSTYGIGIEGGSQYGHGVDAFGRIGVYGDGALHGYGTGVQGDTVHGIGMLATTIDGTALVAQATQGSALELRAPASNGYGPTYLLYGDDDSAANRFAAVTTVSIDSNGNEYLAGTLTTRAPRRRRPNSTMGSSVASYGARSASPDARRFRSGNARERHRARRARSDLRLDDRHAHVSRLRDAPRRFARALHDGADRDRFRRA